MPKNQGLYSVVDFVNKVTVVPPTVMMNDLTAAVTFFQTFSKSDVTKGQPNFQMLCLYKVANIIEDEGDDEGYCHVELDDNPIHLTGKSCKEFIQNEYARLGLDDDFLDSEEK